MTSQLKSDTARANGAKSKGPKTAETRKTSSRNSLKHGFTSRHTMLLVCEDPDLFQRTVDEYNTFYQPANPIERDLVEEIISAKWRIRRLKTIEVALVDHEMDNNWEQLQQKPTPCDGGIHMAVTFKALSDDSRSVALLSRYESRLHRIYHRYHQAFMELRRDTAAGLIGQPQPTTTNQQPATDNHQPTTDNRQPTTASQQPTTTNQQPATNNQQPATASQTASKIKCINEPTEIPICPETKQDLLGASGPTPDTLRESQPKPL